MVVVGKWWTSQLDREVENEKKVVAKGARRKIQSVGKLR